MLRLCLEGVRDGFLGGHLEALVPGLLGCERVDVLFGLRADRFRSALEVRNGPAAVASAVGGGGAEEPDGSRRAQNGSRPNCAPTSCINAFCSTGTSVSASTCRISSACAT